MYIITSEQDNTIYGVYEDFNEAKSVFDSLCNIMTYGDQIQLVEINKSITSERINVCKNANIKNINGKPTKLNPNNNAYFCVRNWMRGEGFGGVEIENRCISPNSMKEEFAIYC